MRPLAARAAAVPAAVVVLAILGSLPTPAAPAAYAASIAPAGDDHTAVRLSAEQVVQDGSTLTIDPPTVVVTPSGREVVFYREDNRTSGSVLVAAIRARTDEAWGRPQRLTPHGTVSYVAEAVGRDTVTVVYRLNRPDSRVVLTQARRLRSDGSWQRAETIGSEQLPRGMGVRFGLVADMDSPAAGVVAWQSHPGVRVSVQDGVGRWAESARFPSMDTVALVARSRGGGIDLVGTRHGEAGPSGVVEHRNDDGTWTRRCFAGCGVRRPPLTLASASADDDGDLAVTWTRTAVSPSTDEHLRSFVRTYHTSVGWSHSRLLARQATAAAVVAVDPSGRVAVSWQTRPPHRITLHLAYASPDGVLSDARRLSTRRPSLFGESAPYALVPDRRTTLVVYTQLRSFDDIDQRRAVVRRCEVTGPCGSWRWVPTNSTDVDVAPLGSDTATVVWADGCTIVYGSCFFERVASRRLEPSRSPVTR